MKINKLLLIFFFSILSCTKFTQKIDSLSDENKNLITESIINNSKICLKKDFQILVENNDALDFYNQNMNLSFLKNKTFINKAASILLLELLRRPDVVSPNSRLQIFIKHNSKSNYFDFIPTNISDEDSLTYFFGINHILKKYSGEELNSLINEIEINIPKSFPVDIGLESFLKENLLDFRKDLILSSYYLKADEPITHFETFDRTNLKNFVLKNNINISKLETKQTNTIQDFKYFSKIDKTNLKCNFDSEQEFDSKFANEDIQNEKIHYIGIKYLDSYFIALISSHLNKPIQNFPNSNFIRTKANITPLPSCLFANEKNTLFLTSIEGRSKSQQIKHLIDYDIFKLKNIEGIQEVLNFPRHLFLPTPDRILYESKRGRKDQLNYFLNMNFPIYHINKIGTVIGFTEFLSNEGMGFLLTDSRSKGSLWCTK